VTSAAHDVFEEAASVEDRPLDISMTDLTNFLVAAMDGLVIQFEVTHDSERCQRDLEHVVRAAILLAGLPAGDTRVAPLGHGRTG
jgi:hypothetical protein